MRAFQFDECSTSKAYIKGCKKQALVATRRYPRSSKGLLDPEMLELYMARDAALITYDRDIWNENEQFVPLINPGIIVVCHSPAIPYTLTHTSAAKILDDFKKKFSAWHSVPWNNSLVTITDSSIEVSQKLNSGIVSRLFKELAEPDWQEELVVCLTQNAAAGSGAPSLVEPESK